MADGDVTQPDGASDLLIAVSDQAETAGGSDASHNEWRTADESLALLDSLIDEVLPAAGSDASLHETLSVDSSVADIERLLDDLRQQRGQHESETISRDPQRDNLEQTSGPLADEAQADLFGADLGTSVNGQTLLESPHAIAGAETTGGAQGPDVGSQEPGAAVVLLDSQLQDSPLLAQAARPGSQLFVYDSTQDSLEDVFSRVIAWAETSDADIESLAILSHGAPGAFEVGNQWIAASSLDQTAADWQRLSSVLVVGANIEIFGCDVAAPGSDGQGLVDQLAGPDRRRCFRLKQCHRPGRRLGAGSRLGRRRTGVGGRAGRAAGPTGAAKNPARRWPGTTRPGAIASRSRSTTPRSRGPAT